MSEERKMDVTTAFGKPNVNDGTMNAPLPNAKPIVKCAVADIRSNGTFCDFCSKRCDGNVIENNNKYPVDIIGKNLICAKNKGKVQLCVITKEQIQRILDGEALVVNGVSIVVATEEQ